MAPNPRNLHRSFPPNRDAGECGICAVPFLAGGPHAFYAAFERDAAGVPVFTADAQLETKGSNRGRVTRRPDGCTCTNTLLHSKGRRRYRRQPARPACALYRACDCGSRDPRRHSRTCSQRIQWQTRDGVWAGMVHVRCAPVSPNDTTIARPGSRTVGVENTTGTGTATPAVARVRGLPSQGGGAPVTPRVVPVSAFAGSQGGQPPLCRARLFYSQDTCALPLGHSGAHVGSGPTIAPVVTPEEVLARLSGGAPAPLPAPTSGAEESGARVPMLDDEPVAPLEDDGEDDPSVQRFRLLDLD